MAGHMAGRRQDGTPIAEAAATLGLSPEAARKRLNRGTLDGYKQDGVWFVVLPPQDTRQDAVSGRQDAPSGQRQDVGAVNRANSPLVTPAEVERAIEATAGRYMADFAGLYDRISAEVAERYEQTVAAKDEALATKDQALAAHQETIAELRRRAEVAEAALAAASAPPAAPQPPSATPPPSAHDDTRFVPAPLVAAGRTHGRGWRAWVGGGGVEG